MQKEIFTKILSNEATEKEKNEFFLSLEDDVEAKKAFCQLKNIDVLDKLHEDQYESIKKQCFNKFWNKVEAKKSQSILLQWFRYAAIFVLAASIGFSAHYFLSNKKQNLQTTRHIEYRSEKGSVSTITLEDGSLIWLSSDSKLTFDISSNGQLETHLKGEAYFDLLPNTKRKLIVDLGFFKIRDIGTKFNVRAYSDEASIFTSLVDGKIELINNAHSAFLAMLPGEYAAYDTENKSIHVSKIDPSLVTSWREGKFVFIDKSLTEICKELENWYNVKIFIKDEKLANTRYTSVIKRTTTVSHVLKMLSLTDKVKYEIKNEKEGDDLIYIR